MVGHRPIIIQDSSLGPPIVQSAVRKPPPNVKPSNPEQLSNSWAKLTQIKVDTKFLQNLFFFTPQ